MVIPFKNASSVGSCVDRVAAVVSGEAVGSALRLADQESQWVHEDRVRAMFRVSREAFNDPEILVRERREIFSKCWLYVGHSSELAGPNAFVTRSVGGRELIFNRDRKGEFRAFLNSCPHRGAMVARDKSGSAISFKCFYHGWAFNNNGKFATRMPPGTYGPEFGKDGCADLVAVPRLDQYRDFWFINFDASSISLSDYLADAKGILDVVADHSAAGMEIVDGVQEYSINANWKLLVENSYDGYHALETHSTYLEYLGDAIGGPAELPYGLARMHDLGHGHAVIQGPAPWGRPVGQWIPAWGEKGKADIANIVAELTSRVGPERAEQIALRNRNMVIFPNLVVNDIMAITVRTFYPERPDYMTVSSWALGPKGEPRDFRKRRLDNFLEFLGPGGFATPDDVEALESAQRSYCNWREAGWNDISRGMLKNTPAPDDEEQMRCFWREWQRRLGGSI